MNKLLVFFKYLFDKSFKIFLSLLSLIILYHITSIGVKYFTIKSLDKPKKFEASIPYFNIEFQTRFRVDDFEDILKTNGSIYYILKLNGFNNYFYDSYDGSTGITIELLDSHGFKMLEKKFNLGELTRINDNKGSIVGFSGLGQINYIDAYIYKEVDNIQVTYTCKFPTLKSMLKNIIPKTGNKE